MKPLNKYILIKQEEKSSTHGLITSTQNEDDKKAERAKVLEIGPEVEQVKKGDTIIFKSYNLFVVEIDGKELSFVEEGDTLAIV